MSPETLRKSTGSQNRRSDKYTDPVKTVSLSDADVRRFWSKVDRRGRGCWLWTASLISDGYGQFTAVESGANARQRHLYAHRVAWTLSHGPIPDGQSVLHHCDVPRCVNPKHLFLGTHRLNMEDAARKGRLHVGRPQKRKITTEQLPQIDKRLAAGEPQASIARAFGVTRAWVHRYAHGSLRKFDRPETLRRVG